MKRGEPAESDVVGAIYEAALEPERWPVVLDRLRDYLRLSSAAIFCQDVSARRANFFFENAGFPRQVVEEFNAHYHYQEPGFRYRQQRPVGTVSATNLLVTDRELERTELYQDCYRRGGFFYTAGASLAREADRSSTLGLQRTRRMGPFSQEDLRRLERLVPHLGRALQIARLFAQEEGARLAAEALLERFPQGVLLVAGDGRIVFANRPALAVLSTQDGLAATGSGLHARLQADDEALARLLREVTATAEGRCGGAGGALQVYRPSGKAPYRVLVLPLPLRNSAFGLVQAEVRAAVLIQDEHGVDGVDRQTLSDLFGLTPAETEVVNGMAQGLSPEEFAERSAKSVHTVRAQLRSIFDKMGVRRQSQLLSHVLQSPALFRADPSR